MAFMLNLGPETLSALAFTAIYCSSPAPAQKKVYLPLCIYSVPERLRMPEHTCLHDVYIIF